MKTAFALAAGLPAADYVYVALAAQARSAGRGKRGSGWGGGGIHGDMQHDLGLVPGAWRLLGYAD